jgi:hypothetical protein
MFKFFLPALAIISLCAGCSGDTYDDAAMCGGRPVNWLSPADRIADHRAIDVLAVTSRDALLWNRRPIARPLLDEYLRHAGKAEERSQVVLSVEAGASCAIVHSLRSSMDARLYCAGAGVCGEGAGWRHWPGAKPVD